LVSETCGFCTAGTVTSAGGGVTGGPEGGVLLAPAALWNEPRRIAQVTVAATQVSDAKTSVAGWDGVRSAHPRSGLMLRAQREAPSLVATMV
jgi:hypothetical protein